MWPIVGAAIGGAASLIGGERANKQAREESARNRQFQERMRNTQWQAAVSDMKQAGINPALAYSQGGAAAPSGSMAQQQDTATPAVSSAMQMRRLQQDLELTRQQVRKAAAEADTAEDTKWWSSQRREFYDKYKGYNMGVGGAELAYMKAERLDQLLGSEHGLNLARAAREQGMAQMTGLGGQAAAGFNEMMPGFNRLMGTAGRGADSIADVVEFLERLARMRDEAVYGAVGIPKKVVLQILERIKRR